MVTSEQEAMFQGIQALIQTVIERRDEGKELLPMDRILLIATQNIPDRIPTGTFFSDAIAKYYGYTLRQIDVDPDLHSDLIANWLKEFDMEFACEGIDTMTTEIEAMGLVKLRHPENAIADIVERYIKSEDDIPLLEEKAEQFDPKTDGRCPLRLELYGKLANKLSGYPLIAAPSAPFAWAVQVLGYKRTVKWMAEKPQLIHRVMDAMTKAEIKWYKALLEAGANGFINIDAWNCVPQFSPKQLYIFEKPYVKRLIGEVFPIPVIHFYWGLRLCGDPGWIEFLEKSAETGTFCLTNLDPDPLVPPSNNLKTFRETALRLKKTYIVGMKDEYFSSRTPDQIRKRLIQIIRDLYPCDGGCVIVPNNIPVGSPPKNFKAFLDALHEFGTYPINKDRLDSALAGLGSVKDIYVDEIKARQAQGICA